jgi:hypothetical protein
MNASSIALLNANKPLRCSVKILLIAALCDANAGLGRGRMVTTTQQQKRRNWRRSLALSLQLCHAQSAALLLQGTLLQPAHTPAALSKPQLARHVHPTTLSLSAVLYSATLCCYAMLHARQS